MILATSLRNMKLLALIGTVLTFSGGSALASGFHIFWRRTGVVAQQQSAPVMSFAPVSTFTVQHSPTTTMQLAPTTSQLQMAPTTTQVYQFAPTTPTQLQFAPTTAQTFQLAPTTTQTFQLAPATTQTVQFAPTSQVLTSNIGVFQSPGTQASPEDQDSMLLAQGFGGKLSMLRSLEDFIKGEVGKNLNRGILNKNEISTLVLDGAKGFLTANGFGLPATLIEPILKRVIGRVLGNTGTSDDGNNGTTQQPMAKPGGGGVSIAGGAFEITGKVYITPVKDSNTTGTVASGTGPTNPPTRTSQNSNTFTIPNSGENAVANP